VLLLAQASSLAITQGFTVSAIAAICTRIEALLPQVDDDRLRFQGYQRLRAYCGAAGKLEDAWRHAQHLLLLAHRLQEPVYHRGACQAAGIVNQQLGRFSVSREYLEQGIALHRQVPANTPKGRLTDSGWIGIFANLAFTLWLLGYPDQARAKAADAVALAETHGDPFSLTIAIFFSLMVYRYIRTVDLAAAQTQRMLALVRQHPMPISKAEGLVAQGWVRAQRGELAAGIDQMRAGIDEMNAMNHTMFQTHRLAWLAEAQMQAGQWTVAAATLDEGFAMAAQSGQRSGDAELHRLRGEWLLQAVAPDQGEAEAWFRQAIEIASMQEAKSFELRAVISLCRLWQRQGHIAEARDRLATIYNWFNEGFDTADLQRARALLAALSLHDL
jgi:tetratricopeptide (TPR) repeat protein